MTKVIVVLVATVNSCSLWLTGKFRMKCQRRTVAERAPDKNILGTRRGSHGARPKGQLAETLVVAEECPHHSISQASMIAEPQC